MDENQSFLQKLNAPIGILWENNKKFVIGFGIIILIIKFREVIIDLLISSSHKWYFYFAGICLFLTLNRTSFAGFGIIYKI